MAQARRDAGLETTRRELLAGAVGTGAGYMDGAVRSGEKAAAEALQALRRGGR